ncbi:MAG: peptidylprolyl isomerase [Pseudomonadota bacterium]
MKVVTKKEILALFLIFFSSISVLNFKAIAETVDRVVAIVNDDIITLTELNDSVKIFLNDTMGVINFDREQTGPEEIKRKILNQLIDNKLIEQRAKKMGIVISQREIDTAIENIYKQNSISRQEFVEQLKSKGLSLEKYEERIKQGMERMKCFNYEIKSKIVISEDELKKYHTENIDSFKAVKEVRVQHVLLLIPPNANEARIEEVYGKARELSVKIHNGEDFGKLAKIYSQEASADSGGDMGWFKPGEIVPFLEKVVFRLKVGEVSDIIRSRVGFHIIKLMERREGEVRPFEEVKDEITDILHSEKVEKELQRWLKELRKKSFVKIKL